MRASKVHINQDPNLDPKFSLIHSKSTLNPSGDLKLSLKPILLSPAPKHSKEDILQCRNFKGFKIQRKVKCVVNKSLTRSHTKEARKTIRDLISCISTDHKRYRRNLSQTNNPRLQNRRIIKKVHKLKSPQRLAHNKNIRKVGQNKFQIRPSDVLEAERCTEDNQETNDSDEVTRSISHLKTTREQIEKDFDRFEKDKPSEKKQIMNLSKLVKLNINVFRKRLEYLNYKDFISSKSSTDLFDKSLKRLRRADNYRLNHMHGSLKEIKELNKTYERPGTLNGCYMQRSQDKTSQHELASSHAGKDNLNSTRKITKLEKFRKSNNHSSVLSKRDVIKVFQKPKIRSSNSRFLLKPIFSKSEL
ncbi:unnamed protein product [Moneuplotes crassus]|uniref:Uncharacterized protein n=1 Tax=Euplotes crassus TaxID=5936 RepID=A0AAD1UD22_EUPCR|nr:unnamed protein product [Moneuplotes crassus]